MSKSRAKPRGRTKKRRKQNPGWFKKGFDARRSSYRFTASDCRVGYLVAACKHPELVEWLRMKIRCFYHQRTKHGKESENRSSNSHAGTVGGDGGGNGARDADLPF